MAVKGVVAEGSFLELDNGAGVIWGVIVSIDMSHPDGKDKMHGVAFHLLTRTHDTSTSR